MAAMPRYRRKLRTGTTARFTTDPGARTTLPPASVAPNAEEEFDAHRSQPRARGLELDVHHLYPTRPDEVVPLLPGETCALATLAMQHPGNVPAAVQLIAAYKG
jgi:hypothetical protein